MPMMDGIEAAEIIRRDCGENGTSPTIIALTANAMEGMREKFLSCGFQDFIAKPLDRKELGQLLARWVPEDRRQADTGAGEEEIASLDPDAFQIEGIDMDVAMRYYTGGEEGFVELLELYHMDGQRKTELLRELAAQADLSDYRTEVHGLKSAAANIGAMEVSNLARAQENAAAQGDREFIARQFPELLAAHQALLERIGAFLEQRRQAQPQAEKLPALSPQELREQVEAALHELEDFRSQECARMVEELLSRDLPPAAERGLREIQGQLKLFEDDNAEALLGQLLSNLKREEGVNE